MMLGTREGYDVMMSVACNKTDLINVHLKYMKLDYISSVVLIILLVVVICCCLVIVICQAIC